MATAAFRWGSSLLCRELFPFFDELIPDDRAADAKQVWIEALTAAGLPHDEPLNHSLVWNGGFSARLRQWRTGLAMELSHRCVAIDFDSAPPSYGVRTVRLDFGGGSNLEITEPMQYVPVEPSHAYHFHAYMRTEEITTESGMRFSIVDPNHNDAVNALTENFTGSHPWTATDMEVTTGPETHFLLVRLLRFGSRLFDNKLSGTVWIADVSLVPAEIQGIPSSMKVIRVGLLFLFAFSVLAFGAVEVWSESLLEIGASILLISWAVVVYRDKQSTIQWSPLNWPLLGFIAVGIVQLVFRWTPNPFLTRTELLRSAAYFIIFFLVAQAFRGRADLVKLTWFLVVLGFSVALLGIIQHFTSEGTVYWYRQLLQGGDVFGPYVNRNHFAGFVELVAPVGLSLLVFRGLRRDLFPMVEFVDNYSRGRPDSLGLARRDRELRV